MKDTLLSSCRTRLDSKMGSAWLIVATIAVSAMFASAEEHPAIQLLKSHRIKVTGEGLAAYFSGLLPTKESRARARKLVQQLASEDYEDREKATEDLMAMSFAAKAELEQGMASTDPEVSSRSKKLHAGIGGGQGVALLRAALSQVRFQKSSICVGPLLTLVPHLPAEYLRNEVAFAVQSAVTEENRKIIQEAIAGKELQTKLVAIPAFARLTKEGKALQALLKDPADIVVLAAALEMADLKNKESIPAFIRLLESEDINVRASSAAALQEISSRVFGFAAYEDEAKRKLAISRWQTWSKDEGTNVEWKVPLQRSARATRSMGGNFLVAAGYRNRIVEFTQDGKEVWSAQLQGVWSAEKLLNGNVLAAAYRQKKVVELNAKGNVVWEFEGAFLKARPLRNGNVLLADHGANKIVEVSRSKKIIWSFKTPTNCADAQRLRNGNTLYAAGKKVTEITSQGKTVWEWQGTFPYSAQRLRNGNTLIADLSGNKVVEVSPDKSVVWEYPVPSPSDAHRLPNGNTLITTAKEALEVSAEKKVLWKQDGVQYGTVRK